MSAFATLIDQEQAQRPVRIGVESVSFTDQRMPSASNNRSLGGTIEVETGGADLETLDQSSFQHTGGAPLLTGPSDQQQRTSGDPFYLNSGHGQANVFGHVSEPSATDQPPSTAQPSRFGTIQLLDSEHDSSDSDGKKKKHKKNHKKKKKKKGTRDNIGVADLAVLSGPSAPRMLSSDVIIGSDDEDEDNLPIAANTSHSTHRKHSTQTKEFADLAKVDLTAPLRDDEVMPKNEHYVVPEKPRSAVFEGGKKKKKKEKREKKDKKKKKDKGRNGGVQAWDATGDLLGFGGVLTNSGKATETKSAQVGGGIAAASAVGGGTAISSAFNDLLDLQPTSSPALGAPVSVSHGGAVAEASLLRVNPSAAERVPSKKSKKRSDGSKKSPWQRATIKISQGTGVGWDSVLLYFRTSPRARRDGPPTATVTFKVVSEQAFQNLQISFDGNVAPELFLGDVSPVSVAESSAKAGPFNYPPDVGSTPEVRGTLHASSGSAVPFKLTLPSTAFLEPVQGVTHERMIDELSSGQWTSHSSKVDISSPGIDAVVVKKALRIFLRAGDVQGNDENSGAVAASCPGTGAQVRALIKVKTSSDGTGVAKVDIKATDAKLGKALASDLKKLVL